MKQVGKVPVCKVCGYVAHDGLDMISHADRMVNEPKHKRWLELHHLNVKRSRHPVKR